MFTKNQQVKVIIEQAKNYGSYTQATPDHKAKDGFTGVVERVVSRGYGSFEFYVKFEDGRGLWFYEHEIQAAELVGV